MLASISVDYYTRLEQGREHRPSRQVLGVLADTLRLDGDARTHLFRLAGLVADDHVRRHAAPVGPEMARLMESWPATPAMVLSTTLDVLARNTLSAALFAGFAEQDNLVRMVFADPFARRFYVDWDRTAHASVASLRASAAAELDSPRLLDLVAEVSAASDAFAELWHRQDVRPKRRETKRFEHPEVGRLELDYETFDIRSAPGQQLVVYHAEPAGRSAQSLALLGSLAAEHPQTRR